MKHLYKIHLLGHEIAYMDTDSLVVHENIEDVSKMITTLHHDDDVSSSIINGDKLGYFKYEYDNIYSFQSFAAKLYTFSLGEADIVKKEI